jgi:hypothetical protein
MTTTPMSIPAESSPRPAPLASWRARALALLVAVLGLALAPEVSAQAAVNRAQADSFAYRIATVKPMSGPPGTQVAVSWVLLPAVTPVQIGVGALRVGFEVVKQVMTDRAGHFADTVVIPEWAEAERAHNFVVLDLYFRPLAVSGTFHVTGPNGLVARTGTLGESAGGCRLMRVEGVDYALAGDLGDFDAGDTVTVEGDIPDEQSCPQGVTMAVRTIRGR